MEIKRKIQKGGKHILAMLEIHSLVSRLMGSQWVRYTHTSRVGRITSDVVRGYERNAIHYG